MFLILALYFVAGTSLAGIFIVAALTAGLTTAQPIIWAAVIGFVVAVPVVWLLARRLRA
ncbi:CTP synthetase [Maritimibacter dapengensis]|uniref:CTP synthetase n=1 Tax=Maritimibacter dapengensis TaxID=2836868 RepID=A0ABS6T7W1_9RHOB|nr:CTP synthetase [Maritimibacter dapengensis]MBV7380808.1 CTP synthetase [Maritimibacter dapengensis]